MKSFKDFQKEHRTDWQDFIWKLFLEKISGNASKKETAEMLGSVISNYEKQMIVRRIAALALINEGKSYKEIGRILWLSPRTISTLKKNLSSQSLVYKSSRRFKSFSREKVVIPIKQKSFIHSIFSDPEFIHFIKNFQLAATKASLSKRL